MAHAGISGWERRLALATEQACDEANGYDKAAQSTRVGKSQLQRCASVNHPDSITIRDAVIVDKISAHVEGHPFILRAMAHQLGFEIFSLPEAAPVAGDWLNHISALSAESSEITTKLCTSLADDQKVCSKDIRRLALIDDAEQLLSITVQLLTGLRAVAEGE